MLLEIEVLHEDLENLRGRAADIIDKCRKEGDVEGEQAMTTTIQILEDKLAALQHQADDKHNELQVCGDHYFHCIICYYHVYTITDI